MKEFIDWLRSDDLPEYVVIALAATAALMTVTLGTVALLLLLSGEFLWAVALIFTPPALVVWYGWANRNKEN